MPTVVGTEVGNLDLLSILRQGSEVWNAWRERNPDIDIEFERVSLSAANLRRANLSAANLEAANLEAAHLRAANLEAANLTFANLTFANLIETNFSGANLELANLIFARLHFANLTRANLKKAFLTRANFMRANLTGVLLTSASLEGANLTRANLEGANLTRANLTGANLTRANLEGANLTGANLTRANLEGAILHGANLDGAVITNTFLAYLDVEVSISVVDRDIDPTSEEELENAIDRYMAAIGHQRSEVLSVERGSLFKTVRYRISKFLTPEIQDKLQEDGKNLYNKGVANLDARLEQPAVESTKQIVEATADLLKAVENFDNIALRLGKLVVVKVTDEGGKSQTFVETISLELQNKLESDPQILRNPQAVADFLKLEEKLSAPAAIAETSRKG